MPRDSQHAVNGEQSGARPCCIADRWFIQHTDSNDTTLRSPDHLIILDLGALRPSKCLMSERSLASVEIRKSLPSVQLTGELKQRNSWRLDCCEPSFPVSPLHFRSWCRALITVSEEAVIITRQLSEVLTIVSCNSTLWLSPCGRRGGGVKTMLGQAGVMSRDIAIFWDTPQTLWSLQHFAVVAR